MLIFAKADRIIDADKDIVLATFTATVFMETPRTRISSVCNCLSRTGAVLHSPPIYQFSLLPMLPLQLPTTPEVIV